MTSNRPVSPAPPGLTRSRLSAVYGDLSQPENLALVESIRRLGVQTPILVDLDSAEVLDGWHRYQAAALAGVECPAVSVFTLSVGQRIALVESGNAHRRHSAPGHLVKAVIDTRLAELGPQAEVDTQALADTYDTRCTGTASVRSSSWRPRPEGKWPATWTPRNRPNHRPRLCPPARRWTWTPCWKWPATAPRPRAEPPATGGTG